MDKKKLAIVVPCYNEEESLTVNIDVFKHTLFALIEKGVIKDDSFICFIDDGSKDKTWELIEKAHGVDFAHIKGLRFTKNYGNQKALIAGLEYALKKGVDCAVTIDADLQQDENAIEKFVDEFHNGAEIVSGIRNDRKTDSFFKKYTALCFYKLMNILGVKIPPNHSDFRLVSYKGLEILEKYSEAGLFLRGFFHEIGLKTAYVYFDVKPRMAGHSKFNFLSLTSLALNGITAYSIVPLRIVVAMGLLTVIGSCLFAAEVVFEKYFLNDMPSGWATLVILLAFFGGLQIFCLGIIGEYIGQIFSEVKARPRYIKEKDI